MSHTNITLLTVLVILLILYNINFVVNSGQINRKLHLCHLDNCISINNDTTIFLVHVQENVLFDP